MVESGLKVGDTVELGKNGGLSKTIITLGEEGPLPQKGQHVFVNYEGKLMDGTVFDSSYDKEAFTVPIGEGNVIKGWDIAVMSMKLGEKVELKCAPEYAYGKEGSPPSIPADATLIYTLELLMCGGRASAEMMKWKDTAQEF